MSNIKINTNYEILTPSGYKSFNGMRKITKDRHFIIKLNNGKIIKCSDNHPFMLDDIKINSNELYVGCKIDSPIEHEVIVNSIEMIEFPIDLYDIIEVDGGNIFNVDGIVSHNCDFLTSGKTVVDPMLLEEIRVSAMIKPPIRKSAPDQNLWIWEEPKYIDGIDYLITADVARGDGTDYSAFHVIDVNKLEQVAEYQGKISTKDYGNLLVNTAVEYNNALLIVENNAIGWAAIQQVIDRGYPNLFYTSSDLQYVDVQHQLHNKYRQQERQMTAGFAMSSKTRPLVVEKMNQYFNEKALTIHSKRLLDELFVFIYFNLRAEAMVGYNDDLVISFAVGLWIRDTALRLRSQGIELQKRSLENISKQETVFMPATTVPKDAWTMDVGNEKEDLTEWL